MWNSGSCQEGRRFPRLQWAVRQAEHILAVFGALVLLYQLCFHLSVNVSGSMAPTLEGESVDDGDWVLTEKVSYRFRSPRRWEVISYPQRGGVWVMKRIVGLPDEKISLSYEKKWVLIDGSALPRPSELEFLEYYSYGNLRKGKSVQCEEGYFVFGDFSRDSQDSRFEGVVRPERIRGRAWLIVWPLSRFGFVR